MMLGMGDVSSSCGANPCGFFDSIFPSASCKTWQTCAAVVNQAPVAVSTDCVVGGLDANGNTIASCGGQDATETPYPVAMSQPTIGVPQWLLLGGVVFGLMMIAGRR